MDRERRCRFAARVEELARATDLAVRAVHRSIGVKFGRGVVGDIVTRVRRGPASQCWLKAC
jgi:hypothetical protein